MGLNTNYLRAIILVVVVGLVAIAKAGAPAQTSSSSASKSSSPAKQSSTTGGAGGAGSSNSTGSSKATEVSNTAATNGATDTANKSKTDTAATSPATPAKAADLTSLPMGKGLPVVVRTGLYFVEVAEFNENDHAFTATVDFRLRWSDPRLSYPPEETPSGFKQFRGEDVEAKLKEMWSPDAALGNMVGEPSYKERGLRIFPDGRVEFLQRTTAVFNTPFDVERFPFDRQKLRVDVVSRRDSIEKVMLDYRQDDLDFSQVAEDVTLEGWGIGLVDISRDQQIGWYGEVHPRLFIALEVSRQAGTSVAPIFIPLFASLLIPLLAMWLNKVEDGEFQIESFELTNIIIGGLFAVIALNFTINSEYKMLASGDNTVSRLFGLNYLTLAASLMINILMFRFGLVKRALGKYVQEQFYLYLVWALPVMVLVSAVAVLLVALV